MRGFPTNPAVSGRSFRNGGATESPPDGVEAPLFS
jgi:hypothetical protein